MGLARWKLAAVSGLVLGAVAGCGGGDPLTSDGAETQDVINAWAEAACRGVEPRIVDQSVLEGDQLAAATCSADPADPDSVDRQQIYVWESPEAVETYIATRSCDQYLYVTGPIWSSSVQSQDVATDLVQAGGELCK